MGLQVKIVSAEAEIFTGEVEMLIASGILGELGIASGHAPLLTKLKPGIVRLELAQKKQQVFYVAGGFLEVQPSNVTVLADVALRAEDIDEASAFEAKRQAEIKMAGRDKNKSFDFKAVSTELAQAAAQIQAIKALRDKLKL